MTCILEIMHSLRIAQCIAPAVVAFRACSLFPELVEVPKWYPVFDFQT